MIILGIETSCDETGAALLKVNGTSLTLLSQSLASSLSLHAKTGGIIPEIAAREQVKYILPVIQEALKKGLNYTISKTPPAIDGIAVTYGPGLIGSLLVGVETAKTLSLLWNMPLYPVNHLYGHIYANWINKSDIPLPALALVVSGGHTDLVLMKSHTDITVLGGTRDDAAGEAFDKIGRLLNLPYPAGPVIASLAESGDKKAFVLPRPMIGSHDFDFSFSGLKTAVLTLIKKNNWDFSDPSFTKNNSQLLSDICASVQEAIIDVITKKTIAAAKKTQVKSILLGGGVSANNKLRERLEVATQTFLPETQLFIPERQFSTDNAAMIAAAAAMQQNTSTWQTLTANPELYF